jgi:hypothetical protein
VVVITLAIGMFLTCMHFLAWGILRMWSSCAPTAYKVVRGCRMFEKLCNRPCSSSVRDNIETVPIADR